MIEQGPVSAGTTGYYGTVNPSPEERTGTATSGTDDRRIAETTSRPSWDSAPPAYDAKSSTLGNCDRFSTKHFSDQSFHCLILFCPQIIEH